MLPKRLFPISMRTLMQSIGIALLAFMLTTAATTWRQRSMSQEREEFARLASKRRAGEHLVLVYIGSARCAWCKNPALPGYIRIITDSLQSLAQRSGYQFATVGVAADVFKAEGIEHLEDIANFDQVAAGGSWLNEVLSDLVWSTYGAPSATPQLLVVSRTVWRNADVDAVTFSLGNERLLARKSGLRAIEDWARSGVALTRIVTPMVAEQVAPSSSP